MAEKLLCPLKTALVPVPTTRIVPGVVGRNIPGPVQGAIVMGDCAGEKCGWWVDTEKKCAIAILGIECGYRLWDRDRPKGQG